MKTKTIYLVTGDDANEPVCAFESKEEVISFCKKQPNLGWQTVKLHCFKWNSLSTRDCFDRIPKDRDFQCLFDDGTITNFYDKHPNAIMTHWRELS